LACTCSCHHSFTSTRRTKHKTPFWRPNTNFLKFFFMGNRKYNCLSKLLNLFIKSSNVSILFTRFFINFHRFNSAIIFVRKFFKKNICIFIYTHKFSRLQSSWLNKIIFTSTRPGTGKKTVFLVLVLTTTHLSSGFSSVSTVPS